MSALLLVLAAAGKMLLAFSPGLVLWLAIVALIGSAKNERAQRCNRRAQKG